ncbi:MAG: FtsQ-type POTRA domain-containing protein [Bacteroidota bacterium]
MAKKRTKQQQARRAKLRTFARGLGIAALVVGLAAAWVWHRTLPLQQIDVVGHTFADADEVRRLAGVAPDSVAPVALYQIDLALVADRVRRQPWVREARLRRLPTGTLRIAVEEREPAVLVVGANGALSHYLDASGYAMPLPEGAAFADVPLLRGAPAFHPTQRVQSAGLRELLAALATADETVDAVISEVEWTSRGAALTTVPVPTRGALPVRLGQTGHADALARLGAFWQQAVLTRPDTPVRLVDLRFAGQVVTQEGTRASPASAPDSPRLGTEAKAPDTLTDDAASPEPAAPSPGTGSDPVASPTSLTP